MEQKKSRLLRLTLMGGQARVFICDTTEMAQQARDIHNASNTCSAAMGRMLAATAIMGANLKSEGDRITATINGGGPAGPICAIAGPDGTVKVTIEHPEVELPLSLQCDCSRDYIERVLLSMGEDEIRDMIEKQNGCEVECHFCRKHYRFSGEELEDLLAQAHRANEQDND